MTTEAWRPPLDFFENNPRARELRGACLNTLATLEKVLKTKNRTPFIPYLYRHHLLDLYSQLEMADGTFQELGIEERMHPDINLDTSHPETISEWIAGQLIEYLGPAIDHLTADDLEPIVNRFYFYLK
ncbi:MAG: hypothetical protein WAV56_01140 [Microgenomates group bacterium]